MPEESNQPVPTGTPKSDENLVAAVSYLWILSIVILLVKKDSDYVRFHARQGVVLFAFSVIVWIVGVMIAFLWPLIYLGDLVILIAVIVGFIKAYSGERFKMPVVGDLAEKVNL